MPYPEPVSAPTQREDQASPRDSVGDPLLPGRWSRWDAYALVTVLVAVGIRGFLLSQAWFWQDDFLHASRALSRGLGVGWILQSYNGHLQPAYFLQVWLTTNAFGLSWPLAAVIVLAWTAAFGASFWFLVTGIFGRGPASLVALGVACLTPLWSVTSSWFASAMQSLPVLTLNVLAAAFAVRLVQSGAGIWGVATVVAYAGALLWFEKALLGLLLVILAVAAAALAGRAPSLRARATLMTGLGLVIVSAAYVIVFLLISGTPESSGLDAADAARLAYEMAFSVVPTGLIGGPWQQNADGSTLQVLITQPWITWIWAAFIVVLIVGWRRHRPSALLATAGVVVAIIPLVWLVARARLDFIGPAIGRDTRYVVDLVPVAALALALLIAGGAAVASPRLGEGPRRALAWAAPMVVVVYALVSWPSVYAVAASRASQGVDDWVLSAVSSLERHPERVVVDGLVPPRVLTSSVGDEARVSAVLAPFGVPASRFDVPAGEWWRLSDDGELEPAVFVPVRALVREAPSGCAVPVRGEPVELDIAPLSDAPGSGVPVVRLGWFSAQTLVPVLQSGDQRWEFPLVDGLGFIVMPLASVGDELIIGGLGPGEEFCLTAVDVGVMG